MFGAVENGVLVLLVVAVLLAVAWAAWVFATAAAAGTFAAVWAARVFAAAVGILAAAWVFPPVGVFVAAGEFADRDLIDQSSVGWANAVDSLGYWANWHLNQDLT